jgi:AcrR family transcriptional regulator
VLDTAGDLFYARGVHEVGMDELITTTGLSKPTVYRLFPTKNELIGAYLDRLASTILAEIDSDVAASRTPQQVLHRIITAIETDLRRPGFRGCPFNNASIEFNDPNHPARAAAATYRRDLLDRLRTLTISAAPRRAAAMRGVARQLAALIDGAYTSAAHLGPDGPASDALILAHSLINNISSSEK